MTKKVTGVYAESHGIVDNNIFEPKEQELFLSSKSINKTSDGFPVDMNGSHRFWFDQSTPLWSTAETAGHATGVFYWEGCQVFNVSYCRPYVSLVDKPMQEYVNIYDDVIADVFNAFSNESDWSLALVYYELIDAQGHAFGFDSPEFRDALKTTDDFVWKILDKRDQSQDDVNVIFVSDHGMMFPKEKTSKFVNLAKYLTTNPSRPFIGSGTIVQLWINDYELFVQTYVNLTQGEIRDGGFTVFAKNVDEDLHAKSSWFIANNDRTADILLIADYGYNINNFGKSWTEPGLHGYDPYKHQEMEGIFIAVGPAFKSKGDYILSQKTRMIDHYNVFCVVLNLACHANNGSWDRVKDLFDDDWLAKNITKSRQSTSIFLLLIFTSFVILVVVVMFKRRKMSSFLYKKCDRNENKNFMTKKELDQ